MGLFGPSKKEVEFENLRESLRTGKSYQNILNFGDSVDVATTDFPESDSARFKAVRDFGQDSFPVFIEFDPTSEYKDAVRVRYKSMHLGWVRKSDSKELVKLLKQHPEKTAIAGDAYLVDLGPRKNPDFSQTRLEVYALAKNFTSKPRTFTYEIKVQTPEQIKKEEETKLRNENIGNQGKAELKLGNWSEIKLSPGDYVCFTGFGFERTALEDIASRNGINIQSSVTKKLTLLVVHESIFDNSAKVRDAIVKGIPVTNLGTYLKINSDLSIKFLKVFPKQCLDISKCVIHEHLL